LTFPATRPSEGHIERLHCGSVKRGDEQQRKNPPGILLVHVCPLLLLMVLETIRRVLARGIDIMHFPRQLCSM
jgi:hypothetical protein